MPRTLLSVLVLAGLTLTGVPALAQGPPAASAVMAAALSRARAEDKTILVEFGASWCSWCRNFEAFVQSPDAGPVLARHFVIVNLTVRERDEKKALEHPGGATLMDEWGGAMSGLPYYVFVNGEGQKVTDSNAMPDGTNIGFPAVPEEIRAFLGVMERAAPRLSAAERDVLDRYLTRVMPRPAPR